MNNPTLCASIRSKLITKEGGLAISQVNPRPVPTIHLQRCYSDSTTAVAIQKCVTEPFGTQYGGTVAGVVSTPGRTTNRRYEINTNVVGLIVTVEVTLVNELNEEVTETLTTNGTTAVLTAAANYKVCNDMRITSASALQSGQRIWCRTQGGTQNNVYHVVLTSTYKYNPIFMCGNKDGVVRNARLTGMQFHSTNTSVGLRLMVFPNNTGTPTAVLNLNNVQGTRINMLQDDTVILAPGQWCIWHRNTGSSINTLIGLSAQWEIYPA